MQPNYAILMILGFATCAALGGQRSSTDYSINLDAIDMGGTTVTSADYSINESVNDSGATAGAPISGYLTKSSYIGQLFDIVGVTPTSTGSTVNEGLTLQLGAAQICDDATFLPLVPSMVTWNVLSGPISRIDSNGLATAAIVYQSTAATVAATFGGFTGTLGLTILNVNNDDFGSYAGDGLPDSWQVQYFGLNNPQAAPNVDADGTGQTNLFKYVAGLNPVDPSSRFTVAIQPVIGQPGQKQIIFAPVIVGRTYTVVSKAMLTDSTSVPLTVSTQSDNGQQRTVTDLSATGSAKFYQVKISLP